LSKPVYEVTVETSYSASHQLRSTEGEVEALHGHNFRVEASVVSPELDRLGLVLDFLELEALLREITGPYDHRHMNDLAPFDELNPSTENMAQLFFQRLQAKLTPRRLEVRRVRVWEAPTFSASYGRS
jgi:6-pyruvoyltetrahydropterin/6-carboxytetrahydropterin synthase